MTFFSKTLEKHIYLVKKVLTLLQPTEFTLKLKKCFFSTDTIDYLGPVIRPRRLEIATCTANGIQKLNRSGNITEFRFCIGLYNVFRLIVSSFAHIAALFNRKLQKDRL